MVIHFSSNFIEQCNRMNGHKTKRSKSERRYTFRKLSFEPRNAMAPALSSQNNIPSQELAIYQHSSQALISSVILIISCATIITIKLSFVEHH